MIRIFFSIFFFSSCLILTAQKWAVRVGFNNLKSYSKVEVTRLDDQRGDLEIKEGRPLADIMVGNRFYFFPQLSNFWDITVTYSIDSTHGLITGFRAINPFITSSITNEFGTHTHGEGVTIPAVLLNYSYTVLQTKKENPSKLMLFGGVAICFRPQGGSLGSGGWGSQTGALDSSGNFYFEYTSAKVVRAYGPEYPLPYLNIGIDGALRLSKRWKVGMELAFYAGTKTLYTQEIEGKTNDADFAYTLKLKPYFFSGGIYFQYRIK
ncbi:hypothetical protein QQ054_00750 [Oscillatoria amoena NRMC-F 0135]|nr:hypothetical protein [Oscillatoria amoena NRMC-F 0135]